MDQLVNSLFSRLEVMVLGAAALALIAYFLAVYHPLKRILLEYFSRLGGFWLSQLKSGGALIGFLQLSVVVVALYYVGVVANAASYWAMEPVRFSILDRIYAPPAATCQGCQPNEVPLDRALALPFTRPASTGASNALYLHDEATVDRSGANIASILDDEIKFIRLLRGALLFCLCAAILSAIKLIIVTLTLPWWLTRKRAYQNLIDENGAWYKELALAGAATSKIENRWRVASRNIFAPHILIMAFSAALYVVAMGSYRGAEFEYSRLVKEAATQAAQPGAPAAP